MQRKLPDENGLADRAIQLMKKKKRPKAAFSGSAGRYCRSLQITEIIGDHLCGHTIGKQNGKQNSCLTGP
jgi:hypothetical protein